MSKAFNVFFTTILVFLLLIGVFGHPSRLMADDPNAKISGSLNLLLTYKKSLNSPLPSGAARLMTGAPVEADRIRAFIYLQNKPDTQKLAELALINVTAYPDSWIPPVGSHPHGFITGSVPLNKIGELAAKPYVILIDSAETQSAPQNDLAAQAVGAGTYWSGGYNGAGVRIAVLDSGLDITHPDIPTPVAKKDYSAWPVLGDNIISPVPGAGAHGTHVAGSAVGRGTLSGGRYRGMAWGSDLVFIKIGNNTNASASSDAMVNALKDSVDVYGVQIINLSYGGWNEHHDGTSAQDQAADYASSRGAAVFVSAGNEAGKAWHCSGTVPAGGTSGFIKINIQNSNGGNCRLIHNLVWYDGPGAHNNLSVQYYDAAFSVLPTQSLARTESVKGTEQRFWWWGPDPDNIFWVPAGAATYYMRITNGSANLQFFHIYYQGAPSGIATVQFDSPDIYSTVSDPAEADSAIAVGSFSHRGTYTNYQGTLINSGEVNNQVSSFSNRGPRVDPGAPQKPFIVSPGSEVISCRDRPNYPLGNDAISNNGVNNGLGPADYTAWRGTSMAAPITAGSAALLMQAYPGLRGNPVALKDLLQQTASRANSPDNNWGFGLFNLQGIFNRLPQRALVSTANGQETLIYSVNSGAITNLQRLEINQLGCSLPPCTFRFGLFSFVITSLAPGARVNVTITMPSAGATEYWKCSGSGWVQVPVISTSANSMVIQLQDGGTGDLDGVANGTIIDPGGPAIPLTAAERNTAALSGDPVMAAEANPTVQPVVIPNLVIQSASMSSNHVAAGQPVKLTTYVANRGTVNSQAVIKVYINGKEETRQPVSLASGQVIPVYFSISRNQPGTYHVLVNNVGAGSFSVDEFGGAELPVFCIIGLLLLGILVVSALLYRQYRA